MIKIVFYLVLCDRNTNTMAVEKHSHCSLMSFVQLCSLILPSLYLISHTPTLFGLSNRFSSLILPSLLPTPSLSSLSKSPSSLIVTSLNLYSLSVQQDKTHFYGIAGSRTQNMFQICRYDCIVQINIPA